MSNRKQKQLTFDSSPEASKIFSDLKNMETPCAGNAWLEGFIVSFISLNDDEKVNDSNLDLIVVPQYGRNLDYTG
ncbi:hypothetical protein CUMW_268170 [Citrus unshiu]|uniref:Uncharacterized protein n=1 Tax=Citrus unshiu TaxID=55188 RepID=A0A2H5QWF4_CITUN|nr:hypothetical protein CUMW_268170 [Citrus unshiu]